MSWDHGPADTEVQCQLDSQVWYATVGFHVALSQRWLQLPLVTLSAGQFELIELAYKLVRQLVMVGLIVILETIFPANHLTNAIIWVVRKTVLQ